jgi:hemerythrin
MSQTTSREIVEKIMHEHDVLCEKVHRIHTVLEHSDPTTDEIDTLLYEFSSALRVHFANEEDEGFFAEVISYAPQLARQADHLCTEHQELIRKVDELCQFAAAGSPSMVWWLELNARCHEVSRQLMLHEREENKLLQQAHQTDIGALD